MKYRFLLWLVVLLTDSFYAYSQQDRFAKIGGQEYNLRKEELIEPQPPILPPIFLPSGIGFSKPFTFYAKPETKESLYTSLDSIRNYFAPFLENFAPLTETDRIRFPITDMKWRKETTEDKKDFTAVLAGQGSWEEVKIPHYGPPLGHAVTYYSKQIELGDDLWSKGSLFICFKGVDYKAEVYLNGVLCGTHEGFFAPFEFDITTVAKKGVNHLLVKVMNEPTTTGSNDGLGNNVVGNKIYAAGGPGYDDPVEGWHICPPGMGIYQDCFIEARSQLFIKDLFVRPLPASASAEVWMEVYNSSLDPKQISVDFSVFGQNFKDTVFFNKNFKPLTRQVPGIGDMVKPTDWQSKSLPMQYGVNYLKFNIPMEDFRWWQTDQPWLYSLHARLNNVSNQVTDRQSRQFGMRSFTMDTLTIPKGRMFLNGQQIRLRGANSMGFEQNDVMRKNWKQLIDDILLAKLCNMNFIRFTQRPVQSEVYEYCDKLGMLNQSDLPFFGAIRISQFSEAIKQAEEMERLVRSHPSAVMVTYINERFPNAEGSPQRSFASSADIFRLFHALDQAVLLSNPDRVIKPGDGDYDPPGPGLPDNHCYNTWYNGHALDLGKFNKGYWQLIKPDWLYGCGEFGAEGLDPLNTMKKYYPTEWLPKDSSDDLLWTASRISKAQTQTMHFMWYPTQKGLQNWIKESQDFQAWAMRFVTEAFRRDSRNVSSAIHLFIDAWPAGWMKAIMDVDRQPKKAYFAYRNALEPMMVSLRTDRYAFFAGEDASLEAWICNDRNKVPENYRLGYEVIVNGKTLVRQMLAANVPENAAQFQGYIKFQLPKLSLRSKLIVKAGLFNENGICVTSNSQDLDVYPAFQPVKAKVQQTGAGKGLTIMKELGLTRVIDVESSNLVIIDRYEDYTNNKMELDGFVNRGGKLLFIELPQGKYEIDHTTVEVKKTIMGEYYFANPSDLLLKDKQFHNRDFFLWYDKETDCLQPLLRHVFRAPSWEPLVTSGLCNFAGEDPSGYLAAAELKKGKGRYLFCEMSLSGRMRENPAAYNLFKKLIQ